MKFSAKSCAFFTLLTLVGLVAAQAPSPEKGKQLALERPETEATQRLEVSSPAFEPGQPLPEQYAQPGRNLSPPLAWSGAPAGTRSFVVIAEDPDAPRPQPFVHWLLYNVPPDTTRLREGIATQSQLEQPAGARQGSNGAGKVGYTGPRPPQGDPPHHYHFQVFALDAMLPLSGVVDLKTLLAAMKGRVLAKGQVVGTYQIP